MFEICSSRTVNPDVGTSLPDTIEEIREAYSLLNGADTVPLETVTVYMESSIPNLRRYLYEVPVSGKGLEGLNYLAYRVKWMDNQDETIFGTVTKTVRPEILQNTVSLSCNIDRSGYLPGTITEAELGEYLLKGCLDMTMEGQAVRSNYEQTGKNCIKKHDGIFHTFGYTSEIREELEPIYGGNKLPDPGFEQTCSFKVWTYKGDLHNNYTLTLLAAESKMDMLKSAMGISD